jgi:8-amino-7-oxononanoate synthase
MKQRSGEKGGPKKTVLDGRSAPEMNRQHAESVDVTRPNGHHLDDKLRETLAVLARDGLARQLRPIDSADGVVISSGHQRLINFAANDYLGLANHPEVLEGGIQAARAFGSGANASRLISGSLRPHLALEEALAQFQKSERALVFESGQAAAHGTIPALLGHDDFVVLDRLAHACLIDGAKLSGAHLRVYAHNDLESLETVLRRIRRSSDRARILIATESLFSMDGDTCPLQALLNLKSRYGAWLLLDEAHAVGQLGPEGRGLAIDAAAEVEVRMGTLSKGFGVAGGFITGSATLIEYLVNRARTFIFSTAPPPFVTGAAMASLRIITSGEGEIRRTRLRENIAQLRSEIHGLLGEFAIAPLIVGSELASLKLATELWERGFFVPAIRFPTVHKNQARLRFAVSAVHEHSQISELGAHVRTRIGDIQAGHGRFAGRND